MDIGNYKNTIYHKITLPDELIQNGNLCGLIEEVNLYEIEEYNSNTLINTSRNSTNMNNHSNILTGVRSSYSRKIFTSKTKTIKQNQNKYKTLNHKDMMEIV